MTKLPPAVRGQPRHKCIRTTPAFPSAPLVPGKSLAGSQIMTEKALEKKKKDKDRWDENKTE